MQINPLLFGGVNYFHNNVRSFEKFSETSFFDVSFRKFKHILLKNYAFEQKQSKCIKLLSFSTIFTFLRPRATDILRVFGPEQKRCVLELRFDRLK